MRTRKPAGPRAGARNVPARLEDGIGGLVEWVEAQAEAVDMVDHATREPYEKGLTV